MYKLNIFYYLYHHQLDLIFKIYTNAHNSTYWTVNGCSSTAALSVEKLV